MEKRDGVLEDVHAGTHCIHNLISMLIILNCAHTQVEEVACQNSRTEWSTAVCDSCVAQLGETDNPQPAGTDKTATFLLRRLKVPSAGPCSHSLPLCTTHSCCPSEWFVLFQAVSSCPHYIPPPRQCLLHVSLQWTWPTENTWPEHPEALSMTCSDPSSLCTASSTGAQKVKQNRSRNTFTPLMCARI